MFQSRWGFHPCDYATFRKLKFLRHLHQKALRMAHAWECWNRKDPHNRVLRRRIRNAKGQTLGYEPPGATSGATYLSGFFTKSSGKAPCG